jgi:hypothetical protein
VLVETEFRGGEEGDAQEDAGKHERIIAATQTQDPFCLRNPL